MFNLDEADLFFGCFLIAQLWSKQVKKEQSDRKYVAFPFACNPAFFSSSSFCFQARITFVLICNADGSQKLKPIVIGKYANPRCFKNVNRQKVCIFVSLRPFSFLPFCISFHVLHIPFVRIDGLSLLCNQEGLDDLQFVSRNNPGHEHPIQEREQKMSFAG